MLLSVKDVKKTFKGKVEAVRGVSFDIDRGESLGLVGESGSGKSTLAKIVMQLVPADSGRVLFDGKKIAGFWRNDLKNFRRKVQVIFQNPFSSLDPRMTVGAALAEPYLIAGIKRRKKIREGVERMLELVGLPLELMKRLPHELSGGECQRVAIARALTLEPELLVCDEPVSSLDLIAQARILNLFLRLQKERSISMLFISHDLRVVRHLCDRIMVMKDGLIVEQGPISQVLVNPQDTYTQELLHSSGLSPKP